MDANSNLFFKHMTNIQPLAETVTWDTCKAIPVELNLGIDGVEYHGVDQQVNHEG